MYNIKIIFEFWRKFIMLKYKLALVLTGFLVGLLNASVAATTVKAEMELLIVCDQEFSHRFGNDRQNFVDYWAVYMLDISRRFQTLQSVDIKFRITSLIIINDTFQQPFVEEARNAAGNISLNAVYKEFGKWVHAHAENFPGFDVALLVTGADLNEDEHYLASLQGFRSACRGHGDWNIVSSTIVLHSSATWGYDCAALEASLATLLGAQDDIDTSCASNPYLMGTGPCDEKQYIFSNCSDRDISSFVNSDKAACLKSSDAPGLDVLKLSKATHPPRISEQCKMVTNDVNAVASNTGESCVTTNCTVWDGENLVFQKKLHPLDNSPCGNGSGRFCFRGRCLPEPKILRNVGSDTCLTAVNEVTSIGPVTVPEMTDCNNSSSPPIKFRIMDDPPYGKQTTISATNSDLCLFYNNGYKDKLGFLFCSLRYDSIFWDIIEIGSQNAFLIRRKGKESCLGVDKEGGVALHTFCDEHNQRHVWAFDDSPPVVSFEWFNGQYGFGSNSENIEREKNSRAVLTATEYIFVAVISTMILILLYRCWTTRKSREPGSYDVVASE